MALMSNFFSKRRPSSDSSSSSNGELKPLRWVITHKLAVGPLPIMDMRSQFQQAGIKAILSLCSEEEGMLPTGFEQDFQCHRWQLPDSHYDESMTVTQLAQAVEIVRQAILNRQPIYVHCLAGMERSPTVCVAYLCQYEHLELWEALNWLKQTNRRTTLTPEQVQVIQSFIQSSRE